MRKWIGYYQNIISNDLCDKLIDYSDNQKPLQPSTYSTSSGKSDRSNERVKMDDGWFRNGEKYYNDITLWWIISKANNLSGNEIQLDPSLTYRIPINTKTLFKKSPRKC